ncbi:formate/nitrite transporter family protein [Methanobrevibacter curvatus]|uniref:Probable formate transporter n=1 Tax=Methanobrevibacter curvatus TaxID=49547 RepID=A0A166A350_9EURY|nr:formate/nitrite transporter family protein [Methanobrevibacter curvatus]KZX11501.1 putative formate transporter 1 [Methanobrevibacter curvatus]
MGSSFKSPADTAKAMVGIAGTKQNSSIINTIILSFFAGAYIAFGGLLAEIVTTGMAAPEFPAGLVKLFFGAVFPVGLMLVVIAGSELFTGNNMYMTFGVLTGKATAGGLVKNWVVSWVFNFVGALFVAYVLATATGLMTAPTVVNGTETFPFAVKAVSVAAPKIKLGFTEALLRGIGCNWLVCLAVYLAIASDDIIGKILGIWFPIMAFVAIGFEHSIANMFFLTLGVFMGERNIAAAGADPNLVTITWQGVFNNLIPVTIGNIIGGAIFVGFLYWFVYLRGQKIE